jgi:hypothetical protein
MGLGAHHPVDNLFKGERLSARVRPAARPQTAEAATAVDLSRKGAYREITPMTLTVLNPQGYPPRVTPKDMAPRLETLEGKKIFLVDCRFDDADIFLAQMQAWFQEHLPGVQAEMIRLSSVYTRDDPQTWDYIKSNGDAAIVGVGH